ncbi:trigger factor [Patescibacteria group bacterium]|nr:trigger factor [Patescibacteria group bacterium]
MNLKTKKLPKNLIEITVELSAKEMQPFYDEAIEYLSEGVQIPGFRAGKAPAYMVKEQIGLAKILEHAAEHAINAKYPEIIKKEKFNPAGPPQVQVQKLAPDNPFIVKLTVALIPEVKLGDYKKIKIKRNKVEVKDEKINQAIEQLQSMRGQETLVNRTCRKGDKVQIDLNLFIDKVPLEDGQMKDFPVTLGNDQYLPGLSDNLTGLKKGNEKEFSFTYPVDHYDKRLAGKKVNFKIMVKDVYQIDLPELDDKFAQSMGPLKTFKELKDKIKENITAEQKDKEEQRVEIEILKQLVEKSEFEDLPEILIEHELDKMIAELKGNIERPDDPTSPKFDDYLTSIKKTEEQLRKEFISKAEERIKTALAIREIAVKENIEVSKEDIKKETEQMKKAYLGQEQIIKNLESESGQIYIANLLTNRKVVESLKNQIK